MNEILINEVDVSNIKSTDPNELQRAYECVVTRKFNCPHKEINGKLCFYCKIPDSKEK